MKASERLRELEDSWARGVTEDAGLAAALGTLLPLIADVVEAAEQAQGPLAQGRRAMMELVWTQMDTTVDARLGHALTALRDALQPPQSEPDIPIRHRPQDDLTAKGRAEVERELERRIVEGSASAPGGGYGSVSAPDLTELAERVKAAEREPAAVTIRKMGEALDRAHQRGRDAEAQRDELVEALRLAIEDVLLMDSPEGDSPRNIAANLRAALAKVRGEAE